MFQGLHRGSNQAGSGGSGGPIPPASLSPLAWYQRGVGVTVIAGPVVHTAGVGPAVTLTGTPPAGIIAGTLPATPLLEIDIVGTGVVGVATFNYLVNGVSFGPVLTAASVVLAPSGLTANFGAGVYTASSDVYKANAIVSAWNDSSLQGDANRNLTDLGGASTAPVYAQVDAAYNGEPSVFFAGSEYLQSGTWSAAGAAPLSVTAVCSATDLLGAAYGFFDDSAILTNCCFYAANAPALAVAYESGAGGFSVTATADVDLILSPSIATVQYDTAGGAGGQACSIFINGQPRLVGTRTTTATGFAGLVMGALGGPADYLKGKIAELIVTPILTPAQVYGLHEYYSNLFAVALLT